MSAKTSRNKHQHVAMVSHTKARYKILVRIDCDERYLVDILLPHHAGL